MTRAIAIAVLTLMIAPTSRAGTGSFSDEDVTKAIEAAKRHLWSRYDEKEGHWPEGTTPGRRGSVIIANYGYGGRTALAVYALLSAGESHELPRMRRALEWLARLQTQGTYVLSLRAQIWAMLPGELGKKMLARDASVLITSINQPGGRSPWTPGAQALYHGTYSYRSAGKPAYVGDHCNTHFGIMGVVVAARAGLNVPRTYWELVFRHYAMAQDPEGAWSYGPSRGGKPKDTMTVVSLVSTLAALENLTAGRPPKEHAAMQATIAKAMGWLDKNFDRPGNYSRGPRCYYWHAIARAGLASGRKSLGGKDWYKTLVAEALSGQGSDGSWPREMYSRSTEVSTSFALLFLAWGRRPVLLSKLKLTGQADRHPCEMACLTRWIGRNLNTQVAWQSLEPSTPLDEWMDAPILYLAGRKLPEFTGAELEKLRRFVQRGGTIFSVTQARGQAFSRGIRQVYTKLFPDYELERCTPKHEIHSARLKISRPVRFSILSNGIRPLVIHCDEDLAQNWQAGSAPARKRACGAAANVFVCVTDEKLLPRGVNRWPAEAEPTPRKTVKLARLKHRGNCDPEPLALERFARRMGKEAQTKLQVLGPMAIPSLPGSGARLASLTGTSSFELTAAEKRTLKDWTHGGGTLLVEAAGGAKEFAGAAEKLMTELFGADAVRLIPPASSLYRLGGMDIRRVSYRPATVKRIGETPRPNLRALWIGKRPALIYSREDLTGGLLGCHARTRDGYEPESAFRIMRNIVLFVARNPGRT